MSLKSKLISTIVSITVAGGALAGAVQPSAAGGLSKGEAAALAGIGGFIIGSAFARYQHHHHGHHVHGVSPWEIHVQRCYARYRTYDHRTDTYFGYDGQYHYCRL